VKHVDALATSSIASLVTENRIGDSLDDRASVIFVEENGDRPGVRLRKAK
jgi:hypothetical protein